MADKRIKDLSGGSLPFATGEDLIAVDGPNDGVRSIPLADYIDDVLDHPPFTLVVDAAYVTASSDNFRWGTLAGAYTQARSIATPLGAGAQVLIITYHDSVGVPLSSDITALPGYVGDAVDGRITAKSAI